MEYILCSEHEKVCCLKTETKPGPNFKKSFYMCSVRESRCQFVQPVSISAITCDKHPSSTVELQIIRCQDNESRCYYRCDERKEGSDWCGFKIKKAATEESEKPIKSNKQADPTYKELVKSEKKDMPSFSSLSKSENKAPMFKKKDIKPVKDANDSFTQWRDSPVKDTSKQTMDKISLTTELRRQKELLSPVQLSAPPDKGARLKDNIQQLEMKIENMDLNENVSKPSKKAFSQPPPLYGGRMTVKRLEVVRKEMDEITSTLHEQLKTCPAEDEEEDDPKGLKVSLMPHQKHALAWLFWRQKQKPSGGILADDMDLGKTLTMISFIMKQKQEASSFKKDVKEEWLKKDSSCVIKSEATLIMTPASLVHQWEKEIESTCKKGLLDVLIYHGPQRVKNDVNKIASMDIVLTSYKIVSLEVGRKEDGKISNKSLIEIEANETKNEAESHGKLPLLMQIHWKNIILDEAHLIRNHKTLNATSVAQLKALSRWMLTGTPIHNKMLDMYSLFRVLRFRPFDEYKVWKNQVESNESMGKVRLNTIVQALMLRRTKDQTVDGKPLIKMTEKKVSCCNLTLSHEEQKLYNKIYKRTQSVVQDYISSHMDKNPDLAENSSSSENHLQKHTTSFQKSQTATKTPTGKDILVFLLRLRQCCCHLSLLKEFIDSDMSEEVGLDLSLTDQLIDLTLQENDFEGYLNEDCEKENSSQQDAKVKDSDTFNIKGQSTKISALIDILKEIYKNKEDTVKCVVVSQWTKLLTIVEYHIKLVGFSWKRIHGSVPSKKRSEIVDDFNTNPKGPEILLLSLKAFVVGRNLIGGSHLFLLDNHWNPALEEQACDHIYRVGQKRDVEIHRFICLNTIEEKIVILQDQKRKLAKDVLTETGQLASRLQLNDLRLLFEIK